MTIPNRYPGQCLTCRKRIPVGAGVAVKVDGKWSTYCSEHNPACNAPAMAVPADPTIELRMRPDGRVTIRPASYLGSDLFDRYRDACGGATYDRETRSNHAAIDTLAGIVTRLARAGFKLDTAPEITAAVQAWEARTASETRAADVRATEVDARLRERGLALFPFQGEGVSWLAPRRGAILGDDMGLGKTIQALTAAPHGSPVLVVAPAVAKGVWARECARWRPDLTPVVLAGRGSFRWPVAGEMVVVNYDILPDGPALARDRREVEASLKAIKRTLTTTDKHPEGSEAARLCAWLAEDDARVAVFATCPQGITVIADEAHAVKGPKAARTQRFRAIARAAFDHDGRVWALTATPLLNRPPELWSLLQMVGMEKVVFGSYPNFLRLCGGERGRFGVQWSGGSGIDAEGIAPKLREAMLRRMKTDVLAQLPAKTVEIIEVDLDPKSIKALDKIAAELAAHGIDLATATQAALQNDSIAFECIARARGLLATAKAAAAMEMADELEEAGEPAVVFSAHRAPVDVLAKREGWATITGDTPPAERTRIEERFQRGELKGIAGTIKAMGVAITLTRAANVVFVDAEWTPALNSQAEDRCYRIGQARAVSIRYLKADHQIDERVFELNAIKRGIIARTTDAAAVRVGELAPRVDVAATMASAAASGDAAERMRAAAELAERVRAERAAFAADQAKRRATIKSENANRNRGWGINPEAFNTPARAAANALEEWAADALAHLASMDADHARDENGVGFSQADTFVGHALAMSAAAGTLNDGEWSCAIRLAKRYPAQVGRFESDVETAS